MAKEKAQKQSSSHPTYIPKASFLLSIVLIGLGALQLLNVYRLDPVVNKSLILAAGVWFLFSSISRGFASKRKALFKRML